MLSLLYLGLLLGTDEVLKLDLPALDGKPLQASEYRGQYVVLNFWATWCAPCVKEMPILSRFDAERDDVSVIGLAYDDTEAADIRKFLLKHPVVYRNAQVDVFAPPAELPVPRGLPLTHLYGPDGRLLEKFIGEITAQDLSKAIAKHQADSGT